MSYDQSGKGDFTLPNGAMEPDAMRLVREIGAPALAGAAQQLSQAISLKRIADILDGNLSVGGFANLEQLAWSMGQAFERGRGAG